MQGLLNWYSLFAKGQMRYKGASPLTRRSLYMPSLFKLTVPILLHKPESICNMFGALGFFRWLICGIVKMDVVTPQDYKGN